MLRRANTTHTTHTSITKRWAMKDKNIKYFTRVIFVQVIEVIRHPTERAESGRGSGSGSAPADEERYRELVKENEELQKLIAQVIFLKYLL